MQSSAVRKHGHMRTVLYIAPGVAVHTPCVYFQHVTVQLERVTPPYCAVEAFLARFVTTAVVPALDVAGQAAAPGLESLLLQAAVQQHASQTM